MRSTTTNAFLAALAAVSVSLAACSAEGPGDDDGGQPGLTSSTAPFGSSGSGSADQNGASAAQVPVGPDDPQPTRGTIDVVDELPHDTSLFTQGLQVVGDRVYESTGQFGSSIIQHRPLAGGGAAPDADAGADAEADEIVEVALDPEHFGEGLAHTGDRVWNLTWQAGVAYDRDPETLEERDRVEYEGEGWGICFDGDRLIMTNGTPEVTFRDPDTFEILDTLWVTAGGTPVERLNELDCTGEEVHANVWQTDEIVRFSPETGVVSAIYDGSHLQQPRPADPEAVLNGVAAMPDSDTFLVTGKLWDAMYEVNFVD